MLSFSIFLSINYILRLTSQVEILTLTLIFQTKELYLTIEIIFFYSLDSLDSIYILNECLYQMTDNVIMLTILFAYNLAMSFKIDIWSFWIRNCKNKLRARRCFMTLHIDTFLIYVLYQKVVRRK